ncbi:MAG: UDP-N-acetylmuramoyl-tripeptide--D-alanyl-D-alanine ligase [Phycisphaerae bacterium]
MKPVTLEEVARAVGGRPLGRMVVTSIRGVQTDSRKDCDGRLFFALVGPTHNGHDHVAEALNKGAVAAVISETQDEGEGADGHDPGRLIQVADTVEALGRLASWYRRQISAQVIAVVGSCGKTTTKDMIAAVLGARRRGRAAVASFNNAIGVPLTLLSVEPQDEFVVVEIGTNHAGEVAALGRIARPNVAVVTSVGEEHLEFFGDIETVAREEMSILLCMRERSCAVINHDAFRFLSTRGQRQQTVLTYGTHKDADLRAVDLRVEASGCRFRLNDRFGYRVPLLGGHNAINALAAIAIGARFRMTDEDMAAGLAAVRPPPMRLERSTIGSVTLINDAYNANPSSMRTAFDVMDHLPHHGRKVLVLGDMGELGEQTERCHRAVGREAGRSTAHVIIAVGRCARIVADGATGTAGTSKRIYSIPTVELLSEKIKDLIEPGDVVLLKASRSVRLERLVQPLTDAARVAMAS